MTFVQNKKKEKPTHLTTKWSVGEYNRLSKEDGDKPESDSIQNQHSINQKHDMAQYHEWAPMRRMAVGGMHHIFELWENMEKFHCDMVVMYDQLLCKGMQGVHGMFEDEFRARDVHAIWLPHALPDKRNVSRAEIRSIINDYMTTVMHEEPIDPSLLEFDDSQSW